MNYLNDRRTVQVMGFLVNKGLLLANFEILPYHGKIKIEDALWVAEHVEPRVLEVLPAAIIHFPKTFIGLKDLPTEFNFLINQIKTKGPIDIDQWKGIRIRDMIRWANLSLSDKRTRPLEDLRRLKSFRFSPRTIEKISLAAKKRSISETRFLENLVESVKL